MPVAAYKSQRRTFGAEQIQLPDLPSLSASVSGMRAVPRNYAAEGVRFGRTTVRLLALYAHPELAYPIVDLTCVRAAVAKNQATPTRRFQVACGQWRR